MRVDVICHPVNSSFYLSKTLTAFVVGARKIQRIRWLARLAMFVYFLKGAKFISTLELVGVFPTMFHFGRTIWSSMHVVSLSFIHFQ